ncbi:MAG: ABC transporter six-transmembrane domain-containing protein [Pseudomonadota bacterium]
MLSSRRLSIWSLVRVFWRQMSVTWGLTLLETVMLAALPLLIGRSIDGLLNNDASAFFWLLGAMGALLILATGRRIYDTRAYGTMRVELGAALVQKATGEPVSAVSARLYMGRELVEFLEKEAPLVLTAVIQVAVAIIVLFSFDMMLALSAGGATAAILLTYAAAGGRFFKLNRDLNGQVEQQVVALESAVPDAIRVHLSAIRRHEVRLSDTEALVYSLIFAVLMAMLGFNLWFAATQTGATPGQIFSIVTYSYELLESAVVLPVALQSLTRIAEITERINGPIKPDTAVEN